MYDIAHVDYLYAKKDEIFKNSSSLYPIWHSLHNLCRQHKKCGSFCKIVQIKKGL